MNLLTLVTLINGIMNGIGPIVAFVGNTPLQLTTGNLAVQGVWMAMVGVADAFLGLYVVLKMIQMMHGEATGTIHLPIGQFVPKVILTVILMHSSAFLGTELLTIINTLCALISVNVQDFVRHVNGGHLFDTTQMLELSGVLVIIFGISLVRVILQAVKRIVFFNVLFVFSGPAFLLSLDMQTAPWFQFWLRTYLVTALEQFFQFVTLGVGFQFLLTSKSTGVTGFVLAIALLNLMAEIPSLMSRFASSAGASAPGLGSFARSAITAVTLFT